MNNIDFLIVGAGLYGATIARLLTNNGYNCLIIDKRPHIAGNIYSENKGLYDKHVYGPHIFHTDDPNVEEFVKKYSKWIQYQLETIATDGDRLYHLPFNMNTYYDIFKTKTPEEAQKIISLEIAENLVNFPKNLEEQAINMVGTTIFNCLIKKYTEKQWGKSCKELSPDIIKRLPLRFSFNNNYFNGKFQGIPENGYTEFVKNIIGNIPCLCDYKFNIEDYKYWSTHINKLIIYCGAVDELLNYELGELEWRSLRFEDKEYIYNGFNGQGNAIINNVGDDQYTRSVEHVWFKPYKIYKGMESIITYEYPEKWEIGKEQYYSVNNSNTNKKYQEYKYLLSNKMPKIFLGGRLGKYQYFDMDDTILEAMKDIDIIKYI